MTAYIFVLANSTATSAADVAGFHYVTPQQLFPNANQHQILQNPQGNQQIFLQHPTASLTSSQDVGQMQPSPLMPANMLYQQANLAGLGTSVTAMQHVKAEESETGEILYTISNNPASTGRFGFSWLQFLIQLLTSIVFIFAFVF